MIRQPFKAPEPVEMETLQSHHMRVVQALEDWVNQPIELTLCDELVNRAAREGRSIEIKIAGLDYMVAQLSNPSNKTG